MAGCLRSLLSSSFRSYSVSRVLVSGGPRQLSFSAVTMATEGALKFETLEVTRPSEWVVQVQLNRPDKSNAMNMAFFREIRECFHLLSSDSQCRSVLLVGAGKNFSAGLDLQDAGTLFQPFSDDDKDVARKAFHIRKMVKPLQDSFTAIEKCPKPVIAAIHSACIGGGVDMITACDIRLCSSDAWFSIKEVDLGLAADIGTLQRLPKVVGNDSLVRELVYTGRRLEAEEALRVGLVSQVYPDREAMVAAGLKLAKTIASKGPVAVQVSKLILNYSRDHSVDESLDYVLTWNTAMLQTEDIMKSVTANITKEPPVFSKL